MPGSTLSLSLLPMGVGGADDSVLRAHIFNDHGYEEVHTSDAEQSKRDLGGDSLQKGGRVGSPKTVMPSSGQVCEPPHRLRSGLPPDQRKKEQMRQSLSPSSSALDKEGLRCICTVLYQNARYCHSPCAHTHTHTHRPPCTLLCPRHTC